MLILIAESKTMTDCRKAVSREEYAAHRPLLESGADALMESLDGLTAAELSAKVKISEAMGGRLKRMIYDFPMKETGQEAMEAFTGVVFRAFGFASLDGDARRRACGRIRIISSLYGWLRPDDIVKPYRFDFTTPLAPGGKTLVSHWKQDVTGLMLQYLEREGEHEVLDLLPADAARCIDWKRIAKAARVCKAGFREVRDGGAVRTPDAGRLKTLRGLLLRQIIADDINSLDGLAGLEAENYVANGFDPAFGVIEFLTAPAALSGGAGR